MIIFYDHRTSLVWIPMADGNISTSAAIGRSSLFYFFTLTSTLFILSWYFLLRSTVRPQFISHAWLPKNKLILSQFDNVNPDKPKGPSDMVEVLKVFMYDMPPEFHFGLLDWKAESPGSVWPDIRAKIPPYPSGGLNLQHSIEYWLTLDLLLSEMMGILGNAGSRAAVRVRNSSEADIIFVPFFSSMSYNHYTKVKRKKKQNSDKILQGKLVRYLENQEEWKRSGGIDHVVMAHHPNSLSEARNQLWPAMFILSDFGRYPPNIANVQKDVIAPYKHVIRSYGNDTSTFESRKTLLYFQGAIYRKDGGFIRQELFYLLKDEKDVHFTFGSVQKHGISKASQGMHSSKFCLNIAGDTPSSNRLFDAIVSHCVPVIVSDEIELPYEDVLDYSQFCVFVRTSDAMKKGNLINIVRGIGKEEWTRMWERLKEVETYFEFRYPSSGEDAVQMIWKAVARKLPAIKFKHNRSHRYTRWARQGTAPPGNKEEQGITFLVPSKFW